MSDLPEINLKKPEEKKKGFLPWLRSRLGFGGRGAIGGAGEAMPGTANFGRAAFGAAKFGSSSGGLAGLLAGKIGLIVTVAVVGTAIGTTLYMKTPFAPMAGMSAFNSNSTTDNYVPAILRQNPNQGSSLDMFKETNRGAISMDEKTDTSKDESAPPAGNTAPAAPATTPKSGDMAQDMVGKLAGGLGGGLSSTAGGGASKFSNMGGFGSKFNTGATGGPTGGIGAGFQTNPIFDQRKKLLAMKSSSQPVFSNAKGGKAVHAGKGALAQAKGVKSTQGTSVGTGVDQQRSTQDKAWEGSTPEGAVSGGEGLSTGHGGSGIVTSPSLDNTGSGGGGAAVGAGDDSAVPDNPGKTDVSPWAGLPQKAMMLILISAVLSVIAAFLTCLGRILMCNPLTAVLGAWIYGIGVAIAVIALLLATMAIMIGVMLMATYGQGMLGTIYTIGGGVAAVAAVMAMTGTPTVLGVPFLWMVAIAAILALIGAMAGGK